MSSKGYVLAYRKSWSHPAFKDLREAAIWNFLYQNAFWEDGVRNFNGNLFELKRGQLVISMSFLANGFCMSEKGVRLVIQKLEKLGMLVKQGASKGTIITICNYDKFQRFEKTKGEQEGKQRANRGRTEDDNNNKINKYNKINRGDTRSKKGTRLEPDFELPSEWGKWAEEQGLGIDEVLKQEEVFKDYWLSQAGQKGVKLDWQATWRNWIRRHKEFKK
jgi:hypothetical protein